MSVAEAPPARSAPPDSLSEWTAALAALLDETAGWAADRGWRAVREPKTILEEPFGAYAAERLRVEAGGVKVLLDPIGRHLPGGDGLVDFGAVAEWDPVMLVRDGAAWWVEGEVGRRSPRPRRWTAEAFADLVDHFGIGLGAGLAAGD